MYKFKHSPLSIPPEPCVTLPRHPLLNTRYPIDLFYCVYDVKITSKYIQPGTNLPWPLTARIVEAFHDNRAYRMVQHVCQPPGSPPAKALIVALCFSAAGTQPVLAWVDVYWFRGYQKEHLDAFPRANSSVTIPYPAALTENVWKAQSDSARERERLGAHCRDESQSHPSASQERRRLPQIVVRDVNGMSHPSDSIEVNAAGPRACDHGEPSEAAGQRRPHPSAEAIRPAKPYQRYQDSLRHEHLRPTMYPAIGDVGLNPYPAGPADMRGL